MWGMGVSVFLNSWTPLVVAVAGVAVGPFVFQFWISVVMALVWFVWLVWACPGFVGRGGVWVWVVRRFLTRDGVLAMLNGFSMAGFVGAALFLDTALVTVITAGWLILFVGSRKRQDSRYQRMVGQRWLLLCVALVGVAFVTFSQADGVSTVGGWGLLWGVLLATVSAVSGSWISFRFRLGTELHRCASGGGLENGGGELACVLVVSVVTSAASIVGSFLLGLVVFPVDVGSGVYLGGFVSTSVGWVLVIGVVSGLGNIAFRYAHLEASNLGVNAMQYLRPVLSLVWLAVFATIVVHRTDFLWVGASAVVAANALINSRSEGRVGVG